MRFWDMTTSECQHSITLAHDISSMTIEEPLNRRLYAGTINGECVLVQERDVLISQLCLPS